MLEATDIPFSLAIEAWGCAICGDLAEWTAGLCEGMDTAAVERWADRDDEWLATSWISDNGSLVQPPYWMALPGAVMWEMRRVGC